MSHSSVVYQIYWKGYRFWFIEIFYGWVSRRDLLYPATHHTQNQSMKSVAAEGLDIKNFWSRLALINESYIKPPEPHMPPQTNPNLLFPLPLSYLSTPENPPRPCILRNQILKGGGDWNGGYKRWKALRWSRESHEPENCGIFKFSKLCKNNSSIPTTIPPCYTKLISLKPPFPSKQRKPWFPFSSSNLTSPFLMF